MKRLAIIVTAALATASAAPAEEATVTYKSLAPDVAFEMAHAALAECRKDGFQVAVVVIDRFGQPLVVLRDRFAGLASITSAKRKAYSSVNFGRDTSALVKMVQDGQISPETARLPNIMITGGGLVVQQAGSTIGGIGVGGAPGGDKDEACAKAGVAAVQDKLDF